MVQSFASSSPYLFPLTVTKTILVAQGQSSQAQLWKSVLESQHHLPVLISPHADLLVDVLKVAAAQPLDLMVVDMTTGLFNPYAFCRECRSQLPDIPVILTHHPGRRIEPAERRWAIYQGAAEVLPGLGGAADILHSLAQIYKAAGWSSPIDTEALYAALGQAGLWPEEGGPPSSPQPTEAGENQERESLVPQPQMKYRLMYRGRPVD